MSAHSAAPLPAGHVSAHARRPVPVWARLAATGLFLQALAPAIMVASGLAAGLALGEDLVFFGLAIAVPAIAGVLVLRFGTWARIVALVATLLVGLSMFWVAFGLSHPGAFADFTPGVSMVLGVLGGLVGSVAAIVAGRRDRVAAGLEGSERTVVLSMLGVLALAAVVSLGLDLTGGEAVAAGADAVPATMHDFSFTEGTITVAAGSEAQVVVHNSDPFVHDFTVPALGVDPVTVGPGEDALVTIVGAEPGSYTIYCTLHSDTDEPDGGEGGMAATLVVE